MSEAKQHSRYAPEQLSNHELEVLRALKYCADKFHAEIAKDDRISLHTARYNLEALLLTGETSPRQLIAALDNKATFIEILLAAELHIKKRKDLKNEVKLSSIERNTHLKYAIAISSITTIVSCIAGPFVSPLLQPVADELFKRAKAPSVSPTPKALPPTIINNYYYLPPTTSITNPSNTAQKADIVRAEKLPTKLTCKRVSMNAYQVSLLELLKRKNVVTLEMGNKKVSFCYRPETESSHPAPVLAR